MYEDQKGYIHFKTNDLHDWHKIVLPLKIVEAILDLL